MLTRPHNGLPMGDLPNVDEYAAGMGMYGKRWSRWEQEHMISICEACYGSGLHGNCEKCNGSGIDYTGVILEGDSDYKLSEPNYARVEASIIPKNWRQIAEEVALKFKEKS